uniref:Uncharacterized protein n=1 Tax=Chlamydomonas leiostraca TaxID=1034604 RepID=A0A7S0RFU6_9CHLO|mmetsp:Transcript_21700/g.55262  ORF Transcript_21700/g.55262 Transcript_21700/m.55262 type:complete len:114 (+) Transcript_21700:175-516(+)|eukprot:CAMPEP_0202868124 /NCGR_PEP_ID=MMETSP1391-20130828/10258_1 /ASSEMBLY_ACC=CAM_ASM_000867 /TAXON_ID=1034604 /ORGANISM="Chlamydomonas leiostraca, Strain SAG 11-49" /LENGTH=113 /DNA_ID=CAMNT_0049548245 /DNA_START=175 /DNA_END=516 /DNA_ORIENTATION=+
MVEEGWRRDIKLVAVIVTILISTGVLFSWGRGYGALDASIGRLDRQMIQVEGELKQVQDDLRHDKDDLRHDLKDLRQHLDDKLDKVHDKMSTLAEHVQGVVVAPGKAPTVIIT